MPWLAPLMVLAAVTVLATTAAAEDICHVIRSGDTPVAVARFYHVSVADILSHNKNLDPCRLKVGDVLHIPRGYATGLPDVPSPAAPATAPSPGQALLPDDEAPGPWYVVAPGDCPAGIAARFGVSLDALNRANPGLDPKNLPVGRVLSIPSAVAAAPPPVTVARPDAPGAAAPLVMDFQ